MDISGVHPPSMNWEDSNLPEAWDKFQRHAELMFSGPLKRKNEEEQISYLLLWVGEKGRDVHATWTLTDIETKSLTSHYEKFKAHVQPKLNPIFARYKFNNEVQGSDSIDRFVTRLRLCARDCNYAEVEKDNMIRDRIVFGTNSVKLREKLINIGGDLTLDRAIQTAQTLEYSQEQLKSMASKDVDACRTRQKYAREKTRIPVKSGDKCTNCGLRHNQGNCPAKGKNCHKCGKYNHFAKLCRSKNSKQKIHCVNDSDNSCSDEDFAADSHQ